MTAIATFPIGVLVRHCEDVMPPYPPEELLNLPMLAEVLDRLPEPRPRQGRRSGRGRDPSR